jgi:putative membrane protein
MNFIIDLLLSAALLFILAIILPGIRIKNYGTDIFVSLVIGILDATIGLLIRLPLDVITLGLLTFIIKLSVTSIMIKIAGNLFKGFRVKNWTYAFLLALGLAIGGVVLQYMGL